MPLTAWTPELDVLQETQGGWSYRPAFTTSQVSEPLATHQTRAVLATAYVDAGSQQRAARWFIEALGGETRPDAEAERAFAAVRAQRVRSLTAVTRRSGPPRSRPA
jgi:hypothetical protein